MKRIRRGISLLAIAAILAFSFPSVTVLADPDPCISVRDYGDHIYNHRVYSQVYLDGVCLERVWIGYIWELHMASGNYVTGECVCGKPGSSFFIDNTWIEYEVGY